LSTMHVQVCTLNRYCVHQCTHLRTRSLCAYALMHVQFVHSALGNESWGVQLVYEGTYGWRGGLFLTKGEMGVLSVSFLFLTRVGVYVRICVCIRTHTHTLHRWGTWM